MHRGYSAEEFTEIGYGEQTEDFGDKESTYLEEVIVKQVANMDFLDNEYRSRFRHMLLKHKGAFGCKYSQVRMSKLTPLEVELRDDAPQSITAAGRPTRHEKGYFCRTRSTILRG